MRRVFEVSKNNPDAIVVIFINGKPYWLTGAVYIESNVWMFKAIKDKSQTIKARDFVSFVEQEAASDSCWSDDIYVSAIDRCLKGDFAVCIDGDPGDTDVDYYKVDKIVEGADEIAISVKL